MSKPYTDADLHEGIIALRRRAGLPISDLVEAVLDAVAPAIAARAKAEALREFANTMLAPSDDSLGRYLTDGGTCRHFANVARARADEIEAAS